MGMIAHNILEDQSPKKLLEIRCETFRLVALALINVQGSILRAAGELHPTGANLAEAGA